MKTIAEDTYFIDTSAPRTRINGVLFSDLGRARQLLEREGIEYREERWQPETVAIYVPAGTDVSAVFA